MSSFRRQLEWYAVSQPDGFVVAQEGGEIIGTGCAMAYPTGRFGWIGLIATDPQHERRGVGRLVTERVAEVLAGHACASVLDASVVGGPLYSRMGFIDKGVTRVLAATQKPLGARSNVMPLSIDDLDDVAAFDAIAFGADRRSLLDVIIMQNPGRGGIARDDDGTVAGYVIAQDAVIGPLVADHPDVATELAQFACALPWEQPPRISMPHETWHLAAVERAGFEQIRELRHMRRGIDVLPGEVGRIAGRISLGVG